MITTDVGKYDGESKQGFPAEVGSVMTWSYRKLYLEEQIKEWTLQMTLQKPMNFDNYMFGREQCHQT